MTNKRLHEFTPKVAPVAAPPRVRARLHSDRRRRPPAPSLLSGCVRRRFGRTGDCRPLDQRMPRLQMLVNELDTESTLVRHYARLAHNRRPIKIRSNYPRGHTHTHPEETSRHWHEILSRQYRLGTGREGGRYLGPGRKRARIPQRGVAPESDHPPMSDDMGLRRAACV